MEAPPSYDAATSSTAPAATTNTTGSSSNDSHFLKARNGIPPLSRRSMEDESRPLPEGWIRQFDAENQHQFYVDTTKEPPRSIWQHPYDDDTYMSSITPEERARINGLHRVPSEADVIAESSEDDEFHDHRLSGGKQTAGQAQGQNREHFPSQLPQRGEAQPKGLHKFGRKMKDKITNSTHEERERERAQRAQEEERIYRQHQMYRAAMAKAIETGQPQLIGKDRQGKDVYIEPPQGYGYGGGFPGVGGYGHGGYGYNPYSSGPYAPPDARYIRPSYPYARPYGYGYGGGLGLPIGLGVGAGLLGGALLF
jgi:hypothetical protein